MPLSFQQLKLLKKIHLVICYTRGIHFKSLVLLANVDGRQFGLWHGCGVVHQHHHRININIVVVLWWRGRSPNLCWKSHVRNEETEIFGLFCACDGLRYTWLKSAPHTHSIIISHFLYS